MVRFGIVGLGYWGPNYVRAASGIVGGELRYCCDQSPSALEQIVTLAPLVRCTTEYEDLLTATDCDALIIATPTRFHYDLTRRALAAGKHVLVEKPLTKNVESSRAIVKAAQRAGVVAMVGHVYLFNAAVEFIVEEARSGISGKARAFFASRMAFSPIRDDVDALWDLAPHDIAIMLAIANEVPQYASAMGNDYLRAGRDDVAVGSLQFPSGAVGALRASWMFPYKERRFDFVGEHRTYVFDELKSEGKLMVYQGSEKTRDGVTVVPELPFAEPLKAQLQHFINAIKDGTAVRTPFEQGAAVVTALAALTRSRVEHRVVALEEEQ